MISVAIATYNGAKFLPEQLDSILDQSHKVDEIVVSDDNSTDETWNILNRYAEKHPGIFKLFRNPAPAGCAANFEHALRHCAGDIIFLADQDDVWLKDKVEKMLAAFNSPQVLGVYSDSQVVNADLAPLGYTHLQLRGFRPDKLPQLPQTELFLRRVPPAAHDMAIRRRVLKQLLPFPKLKNVHDSFIGLVIAAKGGWAVVPESLTLFRQHGGNASDSGQKRTLSGQFSAAKRSIADDTFLWNAKLHAFVLARLSCRLDDYVESKFKERVRHSENRSKMGKVNFFYRLWLVAEELFSLRYFHYARGIKSVIQDIFLR